MGTKSKKGAMCRICLRKKRKFVSIFKNLHEFRYSIAYVVMECAPVHISLEDGFPTWICTICLNNLEIVHQFRKLAVQSEKKLNNMLKRERNKAKNIDTKYLKPEIDGVNKSFSSGNASDMNSSTINYTTTDNFYSPQPQQSSENIITSDVSLPLENIQQNIKLEPIEIDFNQVDLQNPLRDSETIVKIENTTEYGWNANGASEFQREIKEEYLETCTETNEISKNTDTVRQTENEHLLPLYPNIKFDETEFQQCSNTEENCSNSNLAESYILYDALNRTTAKKSYKRKLPKSSLMYQCKVCKQLFFDCASKNEHMKIHKKYYKCEKCEKTFKKWSGFLAHRRRHNRETPYQCATCDTYYITKNSLVSHLRTHSNERPYKCDRCMKDFRASGQLMNHRRWDKCQPAICMESV